MFVALLAINGQIFLTSTVLQSTAMTNVLLPAKESTEISALIIIICEHKTRKDLEDTYSLFTQTLEMCVKLGNVYFQH